MGQPKVGTLVKTVPAATLILKRDAQTLLCFRVGAQEPQTIPVSDAQEMFEPDLILVARQATGEAKHNCANSADQEDIAGFASTKKPFGLRWFVPELLKHKHIWRDVLLASLAIQLVGLATPLFTQVIIDKVIAHQSQSTLIVLGVALVMFMAFTSVMTWLRQYLVLHTGNRIDAVLGSQVLRHLLHLPMSYFEHRPTGTLVARLHGVETIREFVSGAAVTLVLDLPFFPPPRRSIDIHEEKPCLFLPDPIHQHNMAEGWLRTMKIGTQVCRPNPLINCLNPEFPGSCCGR